MKVACDHWYAEDHVEAVMERMEDLLLDGLTLKEQVCGPRLRLCPFEEDDLDAEEQADL